MRLKLLEVAHDIPSASHCGIARTEARFLTSFTWPKLNKSVKCYCKTCEICQKVAKSHKPKAAPLQPLPLIYEPMKRISLDIVGPLNISPDGLYKYILTPIDNSTHFAFAVPLRSHTVEDVAAALVHIFTQYSFPSEVLTDNSQEFRSAFNDAFWDVFKVRHINISSFHPECNSILERIHRGRKNMLRSVVEKFPNSWADALPWILWSYREVPVETLVFSPFGLMFGRSPRGSLSLIKDAWTDIPNCKIFNKPHVINYMLKLRELKV